jgi:conjugal transfer mating pair stabilization protein TraN
MILLSHPRLRACITWATLVSFVGVHTPSFAADPHAEGTAAGQAANPFVRGGINTPGASAIVPGYTTTPPERAYYGEPNLSTQADAHLAACALTPNDPVCQAQIGTQTSANTPHDPVEPYDPAVLAARRITGNPAGSLDDIAHYYSGCQVSTAPTPAAETRICRQVSGPPASDECPPLVEAGCTLAGTECRQANPDTGACEITENRYICPVPPSSTVAVSNCPGNVFCFAGSCFNTAYTDDPDFARSMSYLEAAREAGTYLDTDSLRVFKGEANKCRHRLLNNCCATDSSGAGMSNQSVSGVGSRLVYDILMNANNRKFIYRGISSLLTGAGFSGSFTSYGVTVAVNGAAVPAGSTVLYSGQGMVVAVDPWTLAIAVIIYVVMSLSECNEEEGKLAMKEGAKLCHTVGTYCSTCMRILGVCVSCTERKTSKCCFNSQLARLISEQGRIQVGKGWGTDEDPDCSGFTIAELQRLDFSRMNLTEFYSSIVPTLPNVSAIQGSNASQSSHCYYGNGKCQ